MVLCRSNLAMKRRILYIGRDSGTCLHRANALRRLGHTVELVNPYRFLPSGRLTHLWIWRTGGLFLENYTARSILSLPLGESFDLIWVDGGELVGPALVRALGRRFGCPILNYNVDNPFQTRDGAKWRLHLQAVPEYDLLIVLRESNVAQAYAQEARDVMRVNLSADEVAHRPQPLTPSELQAWGSDVLFVGTWMPERGPFCARLSQLGIPLAIYGDRWQRAREWRILEHHWRGPGLYLDGDYARAIQAAKVCLGLLSKANRDLITTRTFEIPSLGRPLCAERTSEHTALYVESQEAEFWNTPEECAQKCKLLLEDPERRESLAASGRRRFLRNRTTNQAVLASILDRLFPDQELAQLARVGFQMPEKAGIQ